MQETKTQHSVLRLGAQTIALVHSGHLIGDKLKAWECLSPCDWPSQQSQSGAENLEVSWRVTGS